MNNKYIVDDDKGIRYHPQKGNHPEDVVTQIDFVNESKRENLFRGTVRSYEPGSGDIEIPEVGQGNAVLISEDGQPIEGMEAEVARDNLGYTNPNLHRRIDPKERELPEVSPREYKLGIHGLNSYRTTRIITHDENATSPIIYIDEDGNEIDISEIP